MQHTDSCLLLQTIPGVFLLAGAQPHIPCAEVPQCLYQPLHRDDSDPMGNTGLFRLPPVLTPAGYRISHVFDVSSNVLTGSIPDFLYSENVKDYQASGIALAVSAVPICL